MFGKLTVVRELPPDQRTRPACREFECLCQCGKPTRGQLERLRNRQKQSCGCVYRSSRPTTSRTHGQTGSRVYVAWAHMKQRCNNPKYPEFYLYGGRGIRVCDRWNAFENFFADMAEGHKKHFAQHGRDTSLDRIDVNGNYEPGNCRWATAKIQSNNKRSPREMERWERFEHVEAVLRRAPSVKSMCT